MKIQNGLTEPSKADLNRYRVAGNYKMRSKMTPRWPSRVKKLIFAKVHISSALPMREGFGDLKKRQKIMNKASNFNMKMEMRKNEPSETDFWCFWLHSGVSWGAQREPKMQKRGFRRVAKIGSKKMCRDSSERNWKITKKGHPSNNRSD